MLIQIDKNIILNTNKILSVEKSIRCSLVIYFCDREKPCSYIFGSYDERNSAFNKIIEEINKRSW